MCCSFPQLALLRSLLFRKRKGPYGDYQQLAVPLCLQCENPRRTKGADGHTKRKAGLKFSPCILSLPYLGGHFHKRGEGCLATDECGACGAKRKRTAGRSLEREEEGGRGERKRETKANGKNGGKTLFKISRGLTSPRRFLPPLLCVLRFRLSLWRLAELWVRNDCYNGVVPAVARVCLWKEEGRREAKSPQSTAGFDPAILSFASISSSLHC